MAKEEKESVEAPAGASPMKIVIVAVTLSMLLGGGLVGATFYLVNSMHAAEIEAAEGDGDEAAAEVVLPPQYHSMDPKFIISFNEQNNARYMQFSLEIMTRDSEVIKSLETHMPVIRSNLLMLFGSQGYDEMMSREGKQELLMSAKDDINATLQKLAGDAETVPTVEAAYFNSFVIQ